VSTIDEPEDDEAAEALLNQIELSHPDLVNTYRSDIAARLSALHQDADALIGDVMTLARARKCADESCTACMAHADRRDAAALIAQAVRALNGARALIRPTIEGAR